MGASSCRLRNVEAFAVGSPNLAGVYCWPFLPGETGLALLDAEASRFTQYKIHSVSVAWKTQAATTNTGKVTFALHPGPCVPDKMFPTGKEESTIMQFRPFRAIPVWKSDGFTVGGNQVMSQPWLYTASGDVKTLRTDADKAAFCLYFKGDNTGYMQITYDVTLRFSKPPDP